MNQCKGTSYLGTHESDANKLCNALRLDCQSDLSSSVTKLNPKSKLFVIREAPQTVLPKLFKAWKISHLVFEKDTDAYARDRDEKVMEMAKEAGVQVVVKVGRTLYDPDELVKANGGRPTMSITQVQNVKAILISNHTELMTSRQPRKSATSHAPFLLPNISPTQAIPILTLTKLDPHQTLISTASSAPTPTNLTWTSLVLSMILPFLQCPS